MLPWLCQLLETWSPMLKRKDEGCPDSARERATIALLIAVEYCKATIERCEAASMEILSRKLLSVVARLCKESRARSDISWYGNLMPRPSTHCEGL